MKYIYHHLGLGDHIICNGLVRSLIDPSEEYKMFVKEHNLTSVSFMYRDLNNLSFIVGDDLFANNFIQQSNLSKDDLILAGFTKHPHSKEFDDNFYIQNNLPFENRWKKFKVLRDYEIEKKLYNQLNPNDEKFVLIHSAGSDNIDRIDYSKINDNYEKIFVKKYTENIFDFLYLIEKAEEVHCVESSFHLLVDSVDLNDNIYFHTLKKSRGYSHKIRNKWKIV